MHRITHLVLCFVLSCILASPAFAALPEGGWYWNPNESGRGFNLEIQDNALFLSAFAYRSDGSSVWYVGGGPMSTDRTWSADLFETAGGQCIGCAYRAPALVPAGRVSVTFTTERSATITLLGATINVVRQDWSNSGAASRDALLGEWSMVDGDPAFPVYYGERVSLNMTATSTSGPFAGGNVTGATSRLAVGIYSAADQLYSILVDSSTSYYSLYIFTLNGLNRIEGREWTYLKSSQPTGSGTYFVGHRTKSYARVRGLNAPGVGKRVVEDGTRDMRDAMRAGREGSKAAGDDSSPVVAFETLRRHADAALEAMRGKEAVQ